MRLTHRPVKTIVTGKSGTGKSTYFERVISNGWITYWPTIFVYDWQGEMSQRLKIVPTFRINQLPEALKTGFVCFDPAQEYEGDYETGLDFFSKWAFETCKLADDNKVYCPYPRLICVDELQLLTGSVISHEIKTVMQTGRRAGLDSLFVSQQINEIPNNIRNQTTERVTFQHEDAYVLQVMNEWGFDPQIVEHMQTGEYLWRNDRGEHRHEHLFRGKTLSCPENNVDVPVEKD